MGVNGLTRLVFLAGDPIDHAKGFTEYAEALANAGLNAAYLPVHVPSGQLGHFLAGLLHARNVAGVVATIPHKHEARSLATPDAAARRAGSANLLRPAAQGSGWECSMVDGAGFLAAMDTADMALQGRRVQMLGAGGAGRAVTMAVAERSPALLLVSDVDQGRADALVADVAREFPHLKTESGLGPSDVLVNCSPIGMGNDTALPIELALIPRGGDVYDVINRAHTPLLVAATRLGCRTGYGRSMMLAQIPLVLSWMFDR